MTDYLAECGGRAHPLGNNWGNRRVKNNERDATSVVMPCAMATASAKGMSLRTNEGREGGEGLGGA